MKTKQVKIKMGKEIIEAMKFLGMNPINFLELRKAAGSIEKLHAEMAKKLGA